MVASTAWDLSAGNEFIVNGLPWTVETFHPEVGKVVLVRPGHQPWQTTVRQLIHRTDVRQSTRTRKDLPAASRGRQPKSMLDLPPDKQRHQLLVVLGEPPLRRERHVSEGAEHGVDRRGGIYPGLMLGFQVDASWAGAQLW